ncbi:WEB family protein [Dioscorea alata]|uniref:WEB family protein n=1 Tax=Dioscorea alata TaxID=55571 RepID=A0ACB7TWI6_DIOAL|nr:WEB family protein [Dioscorea alata]
MHFSDNEELRKDEEHGFLKNSLTDSNIQMEIEELTNMETHPKIEVYHKTVEELSAQLTIAEAEREKYIEESRKTQAIIAKLEAENVMITSQLAESDEALDKFIYVVDDLKAAKEELLCKLAELVVAEESKIAALREAELMGKALNEEKEKNKELLARIIELKEALRVSNRAVIDAEEKKAAFFAGIESELLIATEAALKSQEQIEDMRKQLEMRKGLENDLFEKTIRIDYLQLELKREKNQNSSVRKAASDAINELKKLISDMQIMEKINSEKQACIESLQGDVKRLEEELQTTREEAKELNLQIKKLNADIQKMEDEMSVGSLGLEVEIATLKSELHKGRSQIAAAEAAEARARSSLTGMYLAVQQLAIEAEKAKNELRIARLEADSTEVVNKQATEDETEGKDVTADSSELCPGITISVEEYESLIRKAERADVITQTSSNDKPQAVELVEASDVDPEKKELDAANETISELKLSLEVATKRAEVAEEAKALVENYLRKLKGKHRRKKSTSETPEKQEIDIADDKPTLPTSKARRPSGFPAHVRRSTSLTDSKKNENYVPLGKVLNIEFKI